MVGTPTTDSACWSFTRARQFDAKRNGPEQTCLGRTAKAPMQTINLAKGAE